MIQRQSPLGVVLFLSLTLALLAGPASAQLVEEEEVGRLTIGVGIGILLPSMTEVNRNIDVVNPFLNLDEIRSVDHVSDGVLTSLDIRYRLGNTPKEDPDEPHRFLDRITVGFAWGAVNARTGLDDVSRARVRLYTRATTYFPYLMYHLPFLEKAAPRTQLMIGGGPILLQNAYMEWELEDYTTNIFLEETDPVTGEVVVGDISELAGLSNASGSGIGGVLQASGTFMLNSTFSAALDVGYRYGKISNLTLDNAVGQDKRFPGDDDDDPDNDVVRRAGDWTVIDFFLRNPEGTWNGRNREDPGPPPPDGAPGCEDCPLYYEGGDLDIDYSGAFLNFSLRVHFF
jgi:hypothetical protein